MPLVELFLCLIIINLHSALASQPTYLYTVCPATTANFTNHSQYQTNLNSVFSSLYSKSTSPSGFYNTSAGTGTKDAVYGLFLCRGDQNATSCQNCVATATKTDLPNNYCPNKKAGFIAYDECTVRYSNESFFGRMETTPRYGLMNTQNITGNISQFDLVTNMMNSIAVRAANGGSQKKYATSSIAYTSLQTMYGLAQCTPDLSVADCIRCLRVAIMVVPISIGGQILQPSCRVRYEIYPFFNGAFDFSSPPPSPLPSPPTNNTTAAAPVLSPSKAGRKNITKKAIVAIIVPIAALVLVAACIYLIRKEANKKDYLAAAIETGDDLTTLESLQYDFAALQSATNSFSDENKLGEGGFGAVYKGMFSDGQLVAVKRMHISSSQAVQEFKNEVLLVAKLQHRNLVRMLGFCIEGEEKLFIYEYVPNKSLDYFLFDPIKQGQLDWGKRYNILQGIARGMLYLHQDSRLRIVHRDLKAGNILLDMDMNPKISDFGMARIFGVDQTQEKTNRVVGTYGYMSPEYAMHGHFSTKSDVYSFGVLILEIISGKKNSTFYESNNDDDLLSYAWKNWVENKPLEFVDPTIRDSCSSNEVIRCMNLGLLCVQESIEQRPTMATIVLAFDTNSITVPVPEEPALFMKEIVESKFGIRHGLDQSSSKSTPWSYNDVSISEVEPR